MVKFLNTNGAPARRIDHATDDRVESNSSNWSPGENVPELQGLMSSFHLHMAFEVCTTGCSFA